MGRKRGKASPWLGNVYDQAARFLLHLDPEALLLWLLRATPEEVAFVRWLDARHVAWPGGPERTSDTVAWLLDRTANDRPWAVAAETQVVPDPEMFGRLLEYLGSLCRQARPSDLPGDRFAVGALVINLTGKGHASENATLAGTGMRTWLGVVERDLESYSAEDVLGQVGADRAPRLALAYVPLMQNGGDPGIIRTWLDLARQETDQRKREALALAVVFAERAGCEPIWRAALKGWEIMESQIVKEWTAQARAEGETKGKLEGKLEGEVEGEIKGKLQALLQLLQRRFKKLPDDLRSAIEAVKDADRLTAWIDLAIDARTLRKFRESAGL